MKLVVAGYYGYRNWGDEGSLAALLQALREPLALPETEQQRVPVSLTVLSGDPAFTESTYGVCALPRMQLRLVRNAIADSDALLLGGGSLLQDATSLRSLLYYLTLIHWGLKAHGQVLLIGQGLGPLKRRVSRLLVGAVVRRVPFLSVRDADSARLLRTLGVTHATVDADLTWALEAQPPHWEPTPDRRWVGLAPRAWGSAPVIAAFADLCRQIRADGYEPLLIPMQETQDRPLCEAIAASAEACLLPAPKHPAQLLGVMRSLQAVVAMRLHGAIFAAAQGVPVLSVAYDPKVDALASQLGTPRIGLEGLPAGMLEAWRDFMRRRDDLQAGLQPRVAALRETAQQLTERVKTFLGKL